MTTSVTIPNAAGTNPLKGLLEYGQSPWMDYIRRDLLTGGGLKKMIEEDGLRGMTSNPAIFEKSITGSQLYSDILNSAEAKSLDAKGVYERIAIRDVQAACDIFKPIYQATRRRDGYVSLEVSPYLANDTNGTLEEARRLWKTVGRENLMVKVPGTTEGVPAIRQLLEEGLNINITLLFAQSAYEAVAEAFFAALEARALKGQDLSHCASVASFFVSRIDTLVDSKVEDMRKSGKGAPGDLLDTIEGKVAIANAKLTYKKYQELSATPRWKALAAKGAQPQRLLWASTSTKNPKYRDVLYVEELIGAETVDTIPPATFDAFREHGKLRASLTEDVPGAAKVMDNLAKAGISMKEVTDKLLVDGVKLFADAFKTLLDATGKSAGVRQ
ncbi:MAG TPA: transaldolase [Candidatus Saccharimonadales bacterium]|nr:transaldolase [Candidatus Saccharimonadales bacterium]